MSRSQVHRYILIPWIVLAILWCCIYSVECQNREPITEIKGFLVTVSYGGHIKSGDISDRFGANFSPGLHFEYILPSSKWSVGLEGTYQFGRTVKEDVLAPLRNEDGFILSDNGGHADVVLRERGMYLGAYASKLWSKNAEDHWSGWNLTMGLGLLQHKIRIQNNSQDIILLQGEGQKGYDRLSNGLATHLAIGYKYLSRDRRVNYYIGLELMAASTKNRRTWNYDLNEAPGASQFDLLFGIRAAWILPFYRTTDPETIYY